MNLDHLVELDGINKRKKSVQENGMELGVQEGSKLRKEEIKGVVAMCI